MAAVEPQFSAAAALFTASSTKSFSAETWKAKFIDWVIVEDITFRQASSSRLQWLIANGGELANQLLPEHHGTINRWIQEAFKERQKMIIELVKNSRSIIHLSFDLWTALNSFHYLGIVGHFIDTDGRKHDLLLGLPRVIGPHSGENLAPYIKDVINYYEFPTKLGYFVMDNADNNDTCLKTLSQWYPIDPKKRRLRCIGHIINLVVRATIFGSDIYKFEEKLCGASDEFQFELWAKQGAIGKLHNIATYIRRSDQRRQAFRDIQQDISGDDFIFTCEILVDGQTRWNSVFLMIQRGIPYCSYILYTLLTTV